jgi:hypothetical protein
MPVRFSDNKQVADPHRRARTPATLSSAGPQPPLSSSAAALATRAGGLRSTEETVVTDDAIAAAVATLRAVHAAGIDVARAPRFKPLRAALFPLVQLLGGATPGATARGAAVGVVPHAGSSIDAADTGGEAAPAPASAAAASAFVSRVSAALSEGRLADALATLARMREMRVVPKLGAVQRWVRDCDAASVSAGSAASAGNALGLASNTHGAGAAAAADSLRVLDMLLRVAAPHQVAPMPTPPQLLAAAVARGSPLIIHDAWRAPETRPAPEVAAAAPMVPDLSAAALAPFRGLLRVVHIEKAATRLPPNRYDQAIFTNGIEDDRARLADERERMQTDPPSALAAALASALASSSPSSSPVFSPSASQLLENSAAARARVQRFDVSAIPGGVFLLRDVLSTAEAHAIIQATEAAGFSPDQPINRSASVLAHAVVWLPSMAFMDTFVSRVAPFMPSVLGHMSGGGGGSATADGSGGGGDRFVGINRRFRCYRYAPGSVYRAHVDGAWPPSMFDPEDGTLLYDASIGRVLSRLTFLLYLNDGFDDGCTTFMTPAHEVGMLHCTPVKPRCGSVLVFPHGDTAECLVHEGSAVSRGTKYIVRTDVLYTRAGARHE